MVNDDFVQQKFDSLDSKLNQATKELGEELNLLHQVVASLISGYAELAVLIETLVANTLYDGDEAKLKAFQDSLNQQRNKMISVIKNELGVNLEDDGKPVS